jgi:YesN/AraC family two-component response regulator
VNIKELNTITSTLNILYVEDDKTLRIQNKEFLEELFHLVKTAKDGEEALSIYEKIDFDIVITDINIPKINGLSMIKMMQEKNKNQIFLITTVYKESELKKELTKLNIKYFLTKPVLTKDLLSEIEKILKELALST